MPPFSSKGGGHNYGNDCTLLGDHRNFKVIEKPARPDLVLKCQMLCWLSGQTFRGSKHKRRQSIFYDIRQIVFRKACKLTPNSWESFSRIFYQASQMCWLSLWSESTRYKTFLLVGMSIRKVVKGIASFCAGQKYSAMKRPGADILQSSRDVKDTSDILETPEQNWQYHQMIRWSDDQMIIKNRCVWCNGDHLRYWLLLRDKWSLLSVKCLKSEMNHYCVVLECFRPLRAWRTPQMSVYYQNGSAGSKTGRSQ